MTVLRITGLGIVLAFGSSGAFAQQPSNRTVTPPSMPAERTIVRTYTSGGVLAARETERRTESDGRQTITSTIEAPDVDGLWRATSETVTEISRSTPTVEHTVHYLYGFGMPGPRFLVETVRSERETYPDGRTRIVQNTFAPDLNGRQSLTLRQVHETTPLAGGAREINTVVSRPGINEALSETERIQEVDNQVDPTLFRSESTRFVRDLNGRLQATDKREFEARQTGNGEFAEEETVFALDLNGRLTTSERTVTHRSETNGQARIESETFSNNVPGLTRAENRLALSHRIRTTTAADTAGGSQTIEELEERVPGAPGDPIRLSRRTVNIMRQIDTNRWQSEQSVYVRDANGQMTLAVHESGETAEK